MNERNTGDSEEHLAKDDELGTPSRPSVEDVDDGAFHTDTVAANGAMQRGMGVGAAELAAQRDPGHAPAANVPDDLDEDADVDSQPDSNRRA